jgi:superfamily II DNA or RNA helicase
VVELRQYQAAAIEGLRAHVRAGRRRICLVCPTGGGKTVVASAIVDSALSLGSRVLFIVHRRELVDQAVTQFARWGVMAGVERGDDSRSNRLLPVQVGTVQTLSRRDRCPADIVFVDECHRVAGDSYVELLSSYPEATIIGLTATPCRLDGKPLGNHFDALEAVATYSQLIADGFLAAPVVYAAKRAPDLTGVRRRAGDYSEEELERAMLDPHVVGDVLEAWRSRAEGRSTVIFAVGVGHSVAMRDQFRAAGVSCEHLDASTPEPERANILAAVRGGEVMCVTNVGILTEGWDEPRVKCCVMARPTLSLGLYMQCVGRILRPWNGVQPVVLDHSGNTSRHGLPHEDRHWSLETATERAPRTKIPYRMCPACYAYVLKNPCEHCGHQTVVQTRELRIEDGSLEEVTLTDKDPRRDAYDKWLFTALNRGYKPGYAAAQYKEAYGEWPPYHWSTKAKALFEGDEQWRKRFEYRERMRAAWGSDEPSKPTT